MPLTTTGDLITSDHTALTARLTPGRPLARQVTRLPGRLGDCSCAVAMTSADAAASGPRPGHRIWPLVGNQAVEPGQTAPRAITINTRPPETAGGGEPARGPVGRQAVGP